MIRSKVQKLLNKYNYKLDDGIMVTDRGSNMVAAFNSFPYTYILHKSPAKQCNRKGY